MYPRMFSRRNAIAHHGLAVELGVAIDAWDERPRRTIGESFAILQQSRAEVAVLSTEYLWKLSAEQITTLRNLTSGCDVSIVAYIRHWSSLIYSRWTQHAKFRPAPTLPEFFLLAIQHPDRFGYSKRLKVWSDIFGPAQIQLVVLDNLEGVDPFHFMCETVIGCEVPPAMPARGVNLSLPFDAAELLRLLHHRRVKQQSALSGDALYRWFERARREGHPTIDAALASFDEVPLISPLRLGWVDAVFRHDAAALSASLGDQIMNPFVGGDSPLSGSAHNGLEVDYRNSANPDTMALVDAIYDEATADCCT